MSDRTRLKYSQSKENGSFDNSLRSDSWETPSYNWVVKKNLSIWSDSKVNFGIFIYFITILLEPLS